MPLPKKAIDKLDAILSGMVKINERIDKLEKKNETTSRDERVRVRPVQKSAESNKKIVVKETSGISGSNIGDPRGNPEWFIKQQRAKLEEQALNQGSHAAVSSYAPPGFEPGNLPARTQIERQLWHAGDVVKCVSCGKNAFRVKDEITTLTKLSYLHYLLEPWAPEVEALTPETEVQTTGGTMFKCSYCGVWAVALMP